MLYDVTKLKHGTTLGPGAMVRLERTTFATQGIQERAHLQAALRDQIDLIDPNLLVISEEFGDFDGVLRRIDLLCVDKNCRLVVVELKRTADGGHMELQALRYAAMVSTMTFSQLVRTFARYRKVRNLLGDSEPEARADLLSWLEVDDDDQPEVPRQVGIVLASEDFSQEITTTVLWLNEFHDFDIRCVRLTPYTLDERILLDVQYLIPLPEASVYTVRVREKENAVRQSSGLLNAADRTKFIVETPAGISDPLPKRWAMLRLVQAMFATGSTMEEISAVLPASKTLRVEGTYQTADSLWSAIVTQLNRSDDSRKRWHVEDWIEVGEHTWVLNNNWGSRTREHFQHLLEIAAEGITVREHVEDGISATPAATVNPLD